MVQVGTGLQEGIQAEVVEAQPLQEVSGSLGCRDLHLKRLGMRLLTCFKSFFMNFPTVKTLVALGLILMSR